MKNIIKKFRITAFIVMVIGFSTAAYAQKSVVVTGIPNNYRGKTGMLALTASTNSKNYTAYSLVIINGAQVTFPLSDWTTNKPWNGNGNYAFVLLIGENAQAISKEQYIYLGQTPATTGIKLDSTAVQWSQFVSSIAAAPETNSQKSITISGIPNNYRGKTGMLALAPSARSQSYTAYSLVIINGAQVTFPLSDWTTNKPWTGNGNFAFVLMIGENAQAITKEQYLYLGQTSETASVMQDTTTVQWSQFASQVAAAKEASQKSITITGIPNTYRGKTGMLALASSARSQNYTAYSLVVINGASVTFPLSDWTTDKPWNGNGNFTFVLLIGENSQAITKKQYLYSGQTDAANIRQDTTTVQWSQFVSSMVQEVKPKSITFAGIPGNYRGKTGMLVLAPSTDNQNYVAYSLVTITTPTTTFPLLDWITDDPWGDNGNFVMLLMVGEDAQSITKEQYLYVGQTTEIINVKQDATPVQWYQFALVKQKPKQPVRSGRNFR